MKLIGEVVRVRLRYIQEYTDSPSAAHGRYRREAFHVPALVLPQSDPIPGVIKVRNSIIELVLTGLVGVGTFSLSQPHDVVVYTGESDREYI